MDWETRKDVLDQFGRDLPLKDFDRYSELLLDWNKRMNLTRITEEDEVMDKHFIDSLTPLLLDEFEGTQKVLDLGTGAGFPGMVLALACPDREVHLMDSLNKRITFLDAVVKDLGIDNVRTFHGRAEEAGRDNYFREKYQIVVSRAVARLPILCEYCLPFVALGGYMIAMKGPEGREEVKDASNAIETLGGRLARTVEFSLPDGDERLLVVIQKVAPTPKKYPRGGGKPRKNPL
ncbi:MAG: 16S rRNA (guanine(527)-N(7))-methyltransferase RsmG [Peptoniphilus sp.]|nr:16S rRNA (guanine(527)-N(7))-methyltransferase RsmG [Peptoniphilus sp.]MDY6044752.1 16S rRNA (guanine(527)-N(7))-methyltransferase RsmG [Peptoniphilus sp.]